MGYSFANQAAIEKSNEVKIDHIPEVQSELPSFNQKVEDSEDNFKQKYVNVDTRTMLKATDIQEIESVQYFKTQTNPLLERTETKPIEVEEPVSNNKPNSSFETKLISSKQELPTPSVFTENKTETTL